MASSQALTKLTPRRAREAQSGLVLASDTKGVGWQKCRQVQSASDLVDRVGSCGWPRMLRQPSQQRHRGAGGRVWPMAPGARRPRECRKCAQSSSNPKDEEIRWLPSTRSAKPTDAVSASTIPVHGIRTGGRNLDLATHSYLLVSLQLNRRVRNVRE